MRCCRAVPAAVAVAVLPAAPAAAARSVAAVVEVEVAVVVAVAVGVEVQSLLILSYQNARIREQCQRRTYRSCDDVCYDLHQRHPIIRTFMLTSELCPVNMKEVPFALHMGWILLISKILRASRMSLGLNANVSGLPFTK